MILEHDFPYDERVEKESISLLNAGYNVTILCPTTIPDRKGQFDHNGIIIERFLTTSIFLKKFRAAALTLPFYFLKWKKEVSKVFLEDSYDFIHVHDLPLARIGIQAGEKYKIATIIDFHENYPYMLQVEPFTQSILGRIFIPITLWKRYERRTIEKINYGFCVVEEMRDRLHQFNNKAHLEILNNTLEESGWPEPTEKPIINNTRNLIKLVFVGRLTPKRGLETAIEGIKIFNRATINRKAHLHIYGHGNEKYIKTLNKLIAINDLMQHVELKGFLNLPHNGHVLSSYDFSLIPNQRSIQTDFSNPNKLYQYLYYGLPIISSDCPSLQRIISTNNLGIIFEAGNPSDFCDKLIELIQLDSDNSIHYTCLKYSEKYGRWKNSETALYNLYNKIKEEAY